MKHPSESDVSSRIWLNGQEEGQFSKHRLYRDLDTLYLNAPMATSQHEPGTVLRDVEIIYIRPERLYKRVVWS